MVAEQRSASHAEEKTVETAPLYTSIAVAARLYETAVQSDYDWPLAQLGLSSSGFWSESRTRLRSHSASTRVQQNAAFVVRRVVLTQAPTVRASGAHESAFVEWAPEMCYALVVERRAAAAELHVGPRREPESSSRMLGPAVLSPRVELLEAARASDDSAEASITLEEEEESSQKEREQQLHGSELLALSCFNSINVVDCNTFLECTVVRVVLLLAFVHLSAVHIIIVLALISSAIQLNSIWF